MAIEYMRDDQQRRILVTMSGVATVNDVLAAIHRQDSEETWSYAMLSDLRTCEFRPTVDEVRTILLEVGVITERRGPRGPLAVVTNDPATYGMGRMYALLGEEMRLRVEVFQTRAAAEGWLSQQQGQAL